MSKKTRELKFMRRQFKKNQREVSLAFRQEVFSLKPHRRLMLAFQIVTLGKWKLKALAVICVIFLSAVLWGAGSLCR